MDVLEGVRVVEMASWQFVPAAAALPRSGTVA
jgi:hypothetical protein